MSVLYFRDEIDGKPVTGIGKLYPISGHNANISSHAERIYISWRTINLCTSPNTNDDSYYFYTNVEVSPSLEFYRTTNCVIPNGSHPKISSNEIIYANISYIFNYEEQPNGGYFFIDLLEESGALSKPPYDPKREGYVFAGWYKDEACTEAWNFSTNQVIIEKDENGNRIYEEIKLFAKWNVL